MKLDKSKPYGTVCGTGENYVYEQDGKKFDGQGDEVGTNKTKNLLVENQKKIDEINETDNGPDNVTIETRLLIIDKNVNGYLSIKEIKAALIEAGVEFNPKNNSRKSLLNALKDYMGVN